MTKGKKDSNANLAKKHGQHTRTKFTTGYVLKKQKSTDVSNSSNTVTESDI